MLCNSSTPNVPAATHCLLSQPRSLNVFRKLTTAAVVTFTACITSLAWERDVNQNGFGAWIQARDGDGMAGAQLEALRVALSATVNRGGKRQPRTRSTRQTSNLSLVE